MKAPGWSRATPFVQSALQHSLIVPALPRYINGVASGAHSADWIVHECPNNQSDLNAQRALYIGNYMAIGVNLARRYLQPRT